MAPFQLLEEAFELAVLPSLQKLCHESGDGEEPDIPAQLTGGEGECRRQVSLPGARVADEEHVLVAVDVFAPNKLADQFLVEDNGEKLVLLFNLMKV